MLVNSILLFLANGVIIKDKIVNFPGFPEVPAFDMYSGYLDIPNSKGKSLFYVFTESQNNPATDPVLLWLNGGPGCSSLAGLFTELGPYIFIGQGLNLVKNPYSWNTNASVLFLESPAGVGFSMMGDASNNNTDDQTTAHDNLLALLQFFKGFSEYRSNPFYISGESYAGIYVPTLALSILNYNSYAPFSQINLQGMAVGNACTDWSYDTNPAYMKMLWTHGMLSPSWNSKVEENCQDFNFFTSKSCWDVMNEIYSQVVPNVNIYNIYDDCYPVTETYETQKFNKKLLSFLLKSGNLEELPACVPLDGIIDYLNNSTVQKAFHVDSSVEKWEICANLDYHEDFLHGSFYTYPNLINGGVNILVYSGDTDGAVPTIGTREWIRNLNLPIVEPYRSWSVGQQVAGYTILYSGLRFVSVKGAGHMVPQYKPAEAHKMIMSWLHGFAL